MDPDLYNAVREHFESGGNKADLRQKLLKQGYSRSKIDAAFENYFNEEKTDIDDRLIGTIESRYRRGENLDNIVNSLIQQGFKPSVIDKAVQRASFDDGSVKQMLGGSAYSYLQVAIIIATLALGFTYHRIFWFATSFVALQLIISSTGITRRDVESTMDDEGTSIGYNITHLFGWWLLNPVVMVATGFIGLGIAGLIIYDVKFALICFFFAGLTVLGAIMNKPQK
jgi:hypothetical protein